MEPARDVGLACIAIAAIPTPDLSSAVPRACVAAAILGLSPHMPTGAQEPRKGTPPCGMARELGGATTVIQANATSPIETYGPLPQPRSARRQLVVARAAVRRRPSVGLEITRLPSAQPTTRASPGARGATLWAIGLLVGPTSPLPMAEAITIRTLGPRRLAMASPLPMSGHKPWACPLASWTLGQEAIHERPIIAHAYGPASGGQVPT